MLGRPAPQARAVAPTLAAKCGIERWPVKSLTDAIASRIQLGKVKTKTVEDLRRLKAPKGLRGTTARGRGTERTVFRITALLTSMKREADSDIHLVVADPRDGGSMIVEFPTGACAATASVASRVAMAKARSALAAACGGAAGSRAVSIAGTATITGVGFFDRVHGQTGVAPNGIELHPALSFASADCRRISPP